MNPDRISDMVDQLDTDSLNVWASLVAEDHRALALEQARRASSIWSTGRLWHRPWAKHARQMATFHATYAAALSAEDAADAAHAVKWAKEAARWAPGGDLAVQEAERAAEREAEERRRIADGVARSVDAWDEDDEDEIQRIADETEAYEQRLAEVEPDWLAAHVDAEASDVADLAGVGLSWDDYNDDEERF